MNIVFLNGQFLEETKASIPIGDRGFLFGDGVFTTIRVCDGTIECFSAHLDRLQHQCQALNIILPILDVSWMQELIQLNHAFHGVWRMKIVITGGSDTSLLLQQRSHGQLLITLKPYLKTSKKFYRLTNYPAPFLSPIAQFKSLSYLHRLYLSEYAFQQQCDDAIVLTPEGFILETSFSNLFWRVDQQLYTPDPSLPLIKGISLSFVEKAVKSLGLEWHAVKVKSHDIPSHGQLYVTNSMIGIIPVDCYLDRNFTRDIPFDSILHTTYRKIIDQTSKSAI